MKRLCLLLSTITLATSLLLAYHRNDKSSFIEWRESRRLSWDDFKGAVPEESKHNAKTHYDLVYSWDCKSGMPKYKVVAVFDRSLSWVRPDKKSDSLLGHEQGHFDLVEIYARKLRRLLSTAKIRCGDNHKTKQEVDKLYKKNKEAMEAEQQRYDLETNYGADLGRQKEWEDKLEEQLKGEALPSLKERACKRMENLLVLNWFEEAAVVLKY